MIRDEGKGDSNSPGNASFPSRQDLVKTASNEAIKWVVVGVLGALAVGVSLLWGWWAAGGLSRMIGALPAGAVVAFDLKDGCPTGWTSYEKGSGRFLMGAVSKDELGKIPGLFARDARGEDLKERPFDMPGGEQRHQLTVDEMPSHTHRLNRNDGRGGNGTYPANSSMGSDNVQQVGETLPAGGNQPHNVLPPYVAIRMCKHD